MSYNRQITINCTNSPSAECTVEAALSIIGGKWKLKIYKVLKMVFLNGIPAWAKLLLIYLKRPLPHSSRKWSGMEL